MKAAGGGGSKNSKGRGGEGGGGERHGGGRGQRGVEEAQTGMAKRRREGEGRKREENIGD